MKSLLARLAPIALMVLCISGARAATAIPPSQNGYPYFVIAGCGTASFTAGSWVPAVVDTSGNLCGNTSGGATAGTTSIGPALTPVVTSSGAAATLVAKAAAGTQFSVYATNLTSTAGFLVGYNATSAPADGALTASLVLECVPLAANSVASVNDQPGPGTAYSVGITYILTSAATCYTKTTGVITGFIKAKVQ